MLVAKCDRCGTAEDENLKLDELIEHRDFLLQLVEDQNKRIRSLRLKRSLKKMSSDKNIMNALDMQNLKDNVEDIK